LRSGLKAALLPTCAALGTCNLLGFAVGLILSFLYILKLGLYEIFTSLPVDFGLKVIGPNDK
jgi:hypothetical protein